MRKTMLAALAAAVSVVLVAGAAFALGEFAPAASFELSDTKTNGNPSLTIGVSQETGEEELDSVTLKLPKGFNLPTDDAIEDGETLGTADITIDVGVRCYDQAVPVSIPVPFSDKDIYEQDRTDEQVDEGVHSVWVVDLQPVTTIPLEVRGSIKKGWELSGNIPANPFTCPPFTFDAVILDKTAGGVPIVTNPAKPGAKLFQATFISADSGTAYVVKQKIAITK